MSLSNQQFIELIYRSASNGDLYLSLYEHFQSYLDEHSDPDDHEQHASVMAHLRQSAQISQNLLESQQQQQLYLKLADQIPTGLILLDGNANIVFANQSGLSSLELTSLDQAQALQLACEQQLNHLRQRLKQWQTELPQEPEAMLLESPTRISLMALLSPLADAKAMLGHQLPDAAVAVLFISPRADSPIQYEQLQALYKLTPAEAFIAGKLACAYSTEDIAKMRRSTVATIRAYIKSILQKTGTAKQQELVSLILRSPLTIQTQQANNAVGRDQSIVLSDQRQLSYRCYGKPSDTPLVLAHASLSCRLEAPLDVAALVEQGYYLIVAERAGYGLSSGPAYHQLVDYAKDIRQLLDQLEIDSAYFIGHLAGGCFALAMAYTYPQRVKQVLLLESFAPGIKPQDIKGAPFFFRHFPRLCLNAPQLALYALRLSMFEFKRKPELSYQNLMGLFNDTDKQILGLPELQNQVIPQVIEAANQGVEALLQDIILTSSDWGFDITKIQTHCHLAYGQADPVSQTFYQALTKQLPNHSSHLFSEQGFASLFYQNLPTLLQNLDWNTKPPA